MFQELSPKARVSTVERFRVELVTVEREIGRLAEAIASGGELAGLLVALKARQARQTELRHAIVAGEREHTAHGSIVALSNGRCVSG